MAACCPLFLLTGALLRTSSHSEGPVFAHNAKYFSKQPAPLLGGPDSPKEEVDALYDFWYSTPCWREFGYYDAHTQKDNETRDERRWAEKQNKAERKKKQKEEKQRMIKLVDNAVACDPRIKAFKATEKRKKAALEEQKRKEKEAQQNSKREAERAAKAAEEQAEEEKVQSEKDAAEAGVYRADALHQFRFMSHTSRIDCSDRQAVP